MMRDFEIILERQLRIVGVRGPGSGSKDTSNESGQRKG